MNEILRRKALVGGAALGALVLLKRSHAPRAEAAESKEKEEEVSPAEDLMREHGVLKRCLLIYAEVASRLEAKRDVPPDLVPATATLLREFIEQYHERLEEEHLFPRFRKAGQQTALVDVLQQQHDAGRRVTDRILEMSRAGIPGDEIDRRALAAQLDAYTRMYAPHEAREDTVLFPAFRRLVPPEEYAELGERFEEREHELFGEGGFTAKVEAVAALERKLGIYELAQFTPKGER